MNGKVIKRDPEHYQTIKDREGVYIVVEDYDTTYEHALIISVSERVDGQGMLIQKGEWNMGAGGFIKVTNFIGYQTTLPYIVGLGKRTSNWLPIALTILSEFLESSNGALVPLGFALEGDWKKADDGHWYYYDSSGSKLGTTCSHFVYSVLKRAGVRLLDLTDWEEVDHTHPSVKNLVNGFYAPVLTDEQEEHLKNIREHGAKIIRIAPNHLLQAAFLNLEPAVKFGDLSSEVMDEITKRSDPNTPLRRGVQYVEQVEPSKKVEQKEQLFDE